MKGHFRFISKYPLGSAFVIGFLVILVILGWKRVTEPSYAGKGVREWIEQLPHDSGYGSESNEALDALGPRAVPYLVDAMKSPTRFEERLAQRIPGRFRAIAPDTALLHSTSVMAAFKLGQFAILEREQNQRSPNATCPIKDEICAAVLEIIRARPERLPDFTLVLQDVGHLPPEIIAELRVWWRKHPKRAAARQWGVRPVALLLASSGNTELVDEFLPVLLSTTNSLDLRAIAAEALGQLGHREQRVTDALRAALRPMPEMEQGQVSLELVHASLIGCALLVYCPPEAEFWLSRLPDNGVYLEWLFSQPRPSTETWCAAHHFLHWLRDPDGELASTMLARDFGPASPYPRRLEIMNLLGRAGPAAKQFAPALRELLNDPMPGIREAAARALDRIEGPAAK